MDKLTIMFLLLALTSCVKTETKQKADTVRVVRVDTIYIYDSNNVNIEMKGSNNNVVNIGNN